MTQRHSISIYERKAWAYFALAAVLFALCLVGCTTPKEEWNPFYHAPLPATNNVSQPITKLPSANDYSMLIPPVEPVIRKTSLRGSVVETNSQPAKPPKLVRFNWVNSTNENCATEVWMTDDLLKPFKLVFLTTSEGFMLDPTTASMEFVKVRARDTNTGAVSPWATTNVLQ